MYATCGRVAVHKLVGSFLRPHPLGCGVGSSLSFNRLTPTFGVLFDTTLLIQPNFFSPDKSCMSWFFPKPGSFAIRRQNQEAGRSPNWSKTAIYGLKCIKWLIFKIALSKHADWFDLSDIQVRLWTWLSSGFPGMFHRAEFGFKTLISLTILLYLVLENLKQLPESRRRQLRGKLSYLRSGSVINLSPQSKTDLENGQKDTIYTARYIENLSF